MSAGAIAQAISSVTSTVTNALTWKDKARYAAMPAYSDPAHYQKSPTYTLQLIIAGMFLVFIVIGVVIALKE